MVLLMLFDIFSREGKSQAFGTFLQNVNIPCWPFLTDLHQVREIRFGCVPVDVKSFLTCAEFKGNSFFTFVGHKKVKNGRFLNFDTMRLSFAHIDFFHIPT
jgi:hypothetical protein